MLYFKRVSNSFDKDSVGPYLGPNCLQKLSADDTRRQRAISRGLSVMTKDQLSHCPSHPETEMIWAVTRENLSSEFLKKQDSDQSPQLKRLTRKLKFRW